MALGDSPKISVIVPVYNVEQYLPRCIDSILAQTFTDFELLLIDDGSTDNSGKICDEYAFKNNRIRVFHKENGGVASARQLGIDKAQGEYSIHVDSDDWVDENMLEEMYNKVLSEQTDIVVVDYYVNYQNKEFYRKQEFSQPLLKAILNGYVMGSLWNKLIKHSLYQKYSVQFCQDINYCEDVLVLVQILLNHDISISYLNHAYYHYNRENLTSITRNYTQATYVERKNFYQELIKRLPANQYKIEIESVAFEIKSEAFYYRMITKPEFIEGKSMRFFNILKRKCRLKLKLCMCIASLGFYDCSQKLLTYFFYLKK